MKSIVLTVLISIILSGCAAMDDFGRGLAYNSDEQKSERACTPGSSCFANLSPEGQAAVMNRLNYENQMRKKKVRCESYGSTTTCEEVD